MCRVAEGQTQLEGDSLADVMALEVNGGKKNGNAVEGRKPFLW